MDKSCARFRWYRSRLGLTLEQTGRLLGHPLASCKGWSRGNRAVPRAVLRLLAAERLRRYQAARLTLAIEALERIRRVRDYTAEAIAEAALCALQNKTPTPVSSAGAGESSSSPNILAEIQ